MTSWTHLAIDFQLVFDNLPDPCVIISNDFIVLDANKSMLSATATRREEMLGKCIFDVFPANPDEPGATGEQSLRDSIAIVTETKSSHLMAIQRHDMKDERGKYAARYWLPRCVPLLNPVGDVECVLLRVEDVTERELAWQQERKQQHDAITELNKELEAFSYTVAHDLRAPLRAITGFAKMLETEVSEKLSEDSMRQLGRISKNAEKMGTLIDDLLAFSKLGKKAVKFEKVNMVQLVDWALAEIEKSGSYRAQIVVDDLLPVKCDFGMMSQVMVNLIGNAIKYSSKKEHPVINIRSEKKGDENIYSITDNGAGFDMRYKDKLFGVFQRLHGTDEFDGIGVGLAIVNRIINKHKGRIWAEGKVDEGATFYFALPVNIAHR